MDGITPEILQRVAKCAPAWMGARYFEASRFGEYGAWVQFCDADVELHEELSEKINAAACFVMREVISRAGVEWHMSTSEDATGADEFLMCLWPESVRGPSETLATVNAFLKVFEK